jgi:hypothetical protein
MFPVCSVTYVPGLYPRAKLRGPGPRAEAASRWRCSRQLRRRAEAGRDSFSVIASA